MDKQSMLRVHTEPANDVISRHVGGVANLSANDVIKEPE